MNRRDFVAASMAAGGTWLSASAVLEALQSSQTGRGPERAAEYYELRRYRLRRGPAQGIVDTYLKTAALPAWQRAGVGPIGVFSVMIGQDSPTFYVLLVHKSLDAFASLPDRLAADAEYEKAAAPYLNAEATTPAFVRIDASLMRGANMPNLTYMLVYEDMAAHDKQWSAFSADPEWKKLSTTPGYTDAEIVSNISNAYLRPAAYSQI